ncbi:hypothetical protein [Clostridium porci]|uniref:Uncharacterized protein n=1 Tax=Clostridium porci TaxID=2605778 RepID=A0A7X2NPD3_9CLOT|nr:hypothetical protein [Clostridium porci]MSS38596.1 hypothetical protein [Clostridium porci]
MKKEVKVSLCISENDSYVELWKNINPKMGEAEYYGRYTYQDQGTWYYVSDALGYCELFSQYRRKSYFFAARKTGKNIAGIPMLIRIRCPNLKPLSRQSGKKQRRNWLF